VVDHGGLERQEVGHAPRAEADVQACNEPPARLLFRRILGGRPNPEEERRRAQRQRSALGRGAWFHREGRRLGWRRRVPQGLVRVLQGGPRALLPGESVLEAAVRKRLVVARVNTPGPRARGEGRGQGQPHNVWLDRLGETCLNGRPAAGMWEGPPIEQAHQTGPPKSLELAPQLPGAQPRDPAVRGPGPLLPSPRAKRFITRQRVTIRARVTEEEVEWEPTSRRLRQRFLPSTSASTTHVRREAMLPHLGCSVTSQPWPHYVILIHFRNVVMLSCRRTDQIISPQQPYR
jgi:hypothetical protein